MVSKLLFCNNLKCYRMCSGQVFTVLLQ